MSPCCVNQCIPSAESASGAAINYRVRQTLTFSVMTQVQALVQRTDAYQRISRFPLPLKISLQIDGEHYVVYSVGICGQPNSFSANSQHFGKRLSVAAAAEFGSLGVYCLGIEAWLRQLESIVSYQCITYGSCIGNNSSSTIIMAMICTFTKSFNRKNSTKRLWHTIISRIKPRLILYKSTESDFL